MTIPKNKCFMYPSHQYLDYLDGIAERGIAERGTLTEGTDAANCTRLVHSQNPMANVWRNPMQGMVQLTCCNRFVEVRLRAQYPGAAPTHCGRQRGGC